MRILLVSQMYPGPDDPDLGVFVRDLERRSRAAATRSSAPSSTAAAAASAATLDARSRRTRAAALDFEPEVVWAHFLVPSGLIAATSSRAPLVVTAHGRDVRNVGAVPGVAAADAPRRPPRRSA